MNNAISAMLAIVGGVISLAIISVLVSRNANTAGVLNSAGSALGTVIGAAVSPVTGASTGAGAASGGGGLFGASFNSVSSLFGGGS